MSLLVAAMVAANPPHLVFMLGDEVGYNNVQWHSNITQTPRMAELARNGLTLERHYVQRWCAASRTALLTGRYPYNTGLNEYNNPTEEERSAVPSSWASAGSRPSGSTTEPSASCRMYPGSRSSAFSRQTPRA